MFLPPMVSRDQWLTARRELLALEEQLPEQHAALAVARRRLPMVRIEKPYTFEGPHGRVSLEELFEGCRQLIVFHFMFDPAWDTACPTCAAFADRLGPGLQAALRARDTAFAAVSLAPPARLEAVKASRWWDFPWYSSFGSDFNYDFHVTLDERVAPVMDNFTPKAEILAAGTPNDLIVSDIPVEVAGLSCFIRHNGSVFHTYSVYDPGFQEAGHAESLLELTVLGGQALPVPAGHVGQAIDD
ncbi:DUF899 family protein [Micromonospora orduensis]|uniref:DUF899 family protein n=1 Tax=Micromonospora orduensis TaxID=1420891 RepID=UPI0033F0AB3E